MAWPQKIPVVAVGGSGGFFARVLGEVAAAVGEVDEAVFETDVPVGIVFEDYSGGDAFCDDTVARASVGFSTFAERSVKRTVERC